MVIQCQKQVLASLSKIYMITTKIIQNIFLLITTLSIFSSAQANSSSSFLRANQLYHLCSSDSKIDNAVCDGYIMGINDSMYSGHLGNIFKVCPPPGVIPSQVRLIVVKHMQTIPEKLHFVADGVVAEALAMPFQCQGK